jgi:hypothetical protein
MKKLFTLLSLMILVTFSPALYAHFDSLQASDFISETQIPNLEAILDHAEASATPEARIVLIKAREMITTGVIVTGSCWDYIDEIFNRSGYGESKRSLIFRSSLPGPYVDDVLIQEADWLYFINHSFHDVEHSSIFVGWTDFAQKQALMISYAGGNQSRPARYKVYDLSSVYNILRPVP